MASFISPPQRENLGPQLRSSGYLAPAQYDPSVAQKRPPTLAQALASDEILATFTLQELLDARAKIDRLLPAANLKSIDLSRELVLQMLALQNLQASVIDDPGASPAHRAQVANSLSAALSNLVKVQNDVFVSERFKRVENLLIEFVKGLPQEQGQAFLDQYEQTLQGAL